LASRIVIFCDMYFGLDLHVRWPKLISLRQTPCYQMATGKLPPHMVSCPGKGREWEVQKFPPKGDLPWKTSLPFCCQSRPKRASIPPWGLSTRKLHMYVGLLLPK
jgi:hypothetical protein